MNQKVKNSNTPFYPTHPVQDQFGTLMVSFGISKKEQLAATLFVKFIEHHLNTNEILELIQDCNNIAENFFDYEDSQENTNKLIL